MLIFNTAPVAFGALGVPVTVLGAVTGLPATALGAMVGRQLPVMALILPFYVMAIYGGMRSVRALWPVLLVAGGSFAASQFITSNFLDYALTDVLASLGSLIVTLLFLQVWRPAPDPEFRITEAALAQEASVDRSLPGKAGCPGSSCPALVIVWTHFGWVAIGQAEHPVAGPAQCDLDHALQRQALCRRLGLPAARHGHRDPGGGDHHGGPSIRLSPMRVLRMRRQDLRAGVACDHHRDAHHRARLSDELFRARLHAWSRGRLDRLSLRPAVALPRLGRGDAVRQRHVGQRALRQSAGRRRAPAESESRSCSPRPIRPAA